MNQVSSEVPPNWVADWVAKVAKERSREHPPGDFPTLDDLPAARYLDDAFFNLERSQLWQRSWLYAAHIDQLPEQGSYVVWSHGSAPIVLLHGDHGRIRAFYNTCRHRGAPILGAAEGKAGGRLVCGYHGWSYDRSGHLRAVTDSRDWGALDKNCRGLVKVRCERFGNLIFVNEDSGAESLDEFLAPVSRFMQHLPLKDLRLVNRHAFDVECNYKVLIDNFLEAYHFALLHPKTTHRIFDNLGTIIHLWRNGHSVMLSPNRRDDWVDPGTVGMPTMSNTTTIERDHNPSYCIFPNLIMPISATGMPCVAIWPKTVTSSVLEVLWFAPDWGNKQRDPLWDTRIENFDRIVAEDIQLAEPMQHTISSPGFRGVPLNYQERRIYHWNEEVDRRIGIDLIPSGIRVTQMLGSYVEP